MVSREVILASRGTDGTRSGRLLRVLLAAIAPRRPGAFFPPYLSPRSDRPGERAGLESNVGNMNRVSGSQVMRFYPIRQMLISVKSFSFFSFLSEQEDRYRYRILPRKLSQYCGVVS